MNTITYHTWKVRQRLARLVLLSAIALLLLPTITFGTTAAPARSVFLTAASVASLAPLSALKSAQPLTRSHLTLLVQ